MEFNAGFIAENTRKEFFNGEFKNREINVLFQREVAQLQDTQNSDEFKIENIRRNHKFEFPPFPGKIKRSLENSLEIRLRIIEIDDRFDNVIRNLQKIIRDAIGTDGSDEFTNEMEEWIIKTLEILSPIFQIKVKQITASHPCPKDACKGFVINGICAICGVKSCDTCWEIHDEGSDDVVISTNCDPKFIENVRFIKQDTKPCPVCFARIHRISGCFQMFCVLCQIGIDWNTGKQIHDLTNFHNPHRHRFDEIQPGNFDGCERLLMSKNTKELLQKWNPNFTKFFDHSISEIAFYNQFYEKTNLDLRISYLLNKITEDFFKRKVFYRYRVKALYLEERSIIMAWRFLAEEHVGKLNRDEDIEYEQIMAEWTQMITGLETVSKKYGMLSFDTKTMHHQERNWS
jgi:hypothetical protein